LGGFRGIFGSLWGFSGELGEFLEAGRGFTEDAGLFCGSGGVNYKWYRVYILDDMDILYDLIW